MLTSAEIKNVNFSKSMNGYKRDEVEAFLDRVEADFAKYEKILQDYQAKCEAYQAKIDEYKNSQDKIQNVLISAQKLADKIVNDAKVQSEEIVLKAEENINIITLQEKELAEAFEFKASERKNALQKELDAMIEKANLKAKAIDEATNDCIKRQQVLFDKLRLEIAAFKSSVTGKYKEHLSILQDIPDTVDMDPQKMADVLSARIDALPEVDSFIKTETAPLVNEPAAETKQEPFGFSVVEEENDSTQEILE